MRTRACDCVVLGGWRVAAPCVCHNPSREPILERVAAPCIRRELGLGGTLYLLHRSAPPPFWVGRLCGSGERSWGETCYVTISDTTHILISG